MTYRVDCFGDSQAEFTFKSETEATIFARLMQQCQEVDEINIWKFYFRTDKDAVLMLNWKRNEI